jgi:hypothetical protein
MIPLGILIRNQPGTSHFAPTNKKLWHGLQVQLRPLIRIISELFSH